MTHVSPGRFRGKVVIVTGGAQGIGKAVARRLAREGARVVIGDIADEPAAAVADLVRADGGDAAVVSADLATADGARTFVAGAAEHFGPADVLVNNVGGALRVAPFDRFSAVEVEREIARSLWPTLWCCHAVLPSML
ncbi:MAG: SDR family NAD(P)-dependent oxidoreductase, partial [Pseudonocardiaceae bacterium]|nr:SDR family NAD(P)-dependent oxidoreductase [Pseudonocardiaceae bacterium]